MCEFSLILLPAIDRYPKWCLVAGLLDWKDKGVLAVNISWQCYWWREDYVDRDVWRSCDGLKVGWEHAFIQCSLTSRAFLRESPMISVISGLSSLSAESAVPLIPEILREFSSFLSRSSQVIWLGVWYVIDVQVPTWTGTGWLVFTLLWPHYVRLDQGSSQFH